MANELGENGYYEDLYSRDLEKNLANFSNTGRSKAEKLLSHFESRLFDDPNYPAVMVRAIFVHLYLDGVRDEMDFARQLDEYSGLLESLDAKGSEPRFLKAPAR